MFGSSAALSRESASHEQDWPLGASKQQLAAPKQQVAHGPRSTWHAHPQHVLQNVATVPLYQSDESISISKIMKEEIILYNYTIVYYSKKYTYNFFLCRHS